MVTKTEIWVAAVTVIVCLVIAELVLRAKYNDIPDGYANLPGQVLNMKFFWRNVTYHSDENGLRCCSPVNSSSKILFVGNSLVMGAGVNYNETIPYLVGKSLGVETLNAGKSGSSLRDYHVMVEHYINAMHPEVVVVVICVENDLLEENQATKAAFRLRLVDVTYNSFVKRFRASYKSIDNYSEEHGGMNLWELNQAAKHPNSLQETLLLRKVDLARAEENIVRIGNAAAKENVRLLWVLIPSSAQTSLRYHSYRREIGFNITSDLYNNTLVQKFFIGVFEKQGMSYLDLTPLFMDKRYYLDSDMHLDQNGYRVTAEYLAEALV